MVPTISLSSVITREGASLYQRASDYVSSGELNAQIQRWRASRFGRVLLHLIAMAGDGAIRFHAAGIRRELPWTAE